MIPLPRLYEIQRDTKGIEKKKGIFYKSKDIVVIFVKLAQNCHEYTYFLLIDYPLRMYKRLFEKPHIQEDCECR